MLLLLPLRSVATNIYFRAKDCRAKPGNEPILNSIIAGLMTENKMPHGSIVDAGAADGRFACYYAAIAPDRVIHAVDPSYRNVQWMQRQYARRHPNLHPFHAGLGDEPSANLTTRRTMSTANQNFTIHRLDDLFDGPWKGDVLALGHFDVEGWESQVIRGAVRVIERDAPILTTEAEVQRKPDAAQSLIRHLDALQYDSFLVEEITGMQADLRNLLHIPRSRRKQLERSNVLDLAVASRVLFAITADTVQDFAYPCCRLGGVCCPTPQHCCSHNLVHQWMKSVVQHGGADLQWYARTTWYDQYQHVFRPEMKASQQEMRRRNASDSGFSYNTALQAKRRRRRWGRGQGKFKGKGRGGGA